MNPHQLGYDIHGSDDAPVVVLGSSLGTTRSVWDAQLSFLSEQFRVVRYDHLGHGDSTVPPGPYTIESLAADVLRLLNKLGIDQAHVGGISLGGMVALQLAATAPGRVDRLALVCSAAYLPPAQAWRERATVVRARGIAAIANSVVERWFTPNFATTSPAMTCRMDLLRVPTEGYAGCCEAIAAMDLRPLLGAIRAPTLVIAGANDSATPVDHAMTIVDGIQSSGTSARAEIVTDAAHLANVERPDEVGRLLVEHFTAK